jgi:heparosan-N-sulfate-glucuronate 5-epimerase
MFRGKSYYHQPQRTGRMFQAGAVRGYFNDLTGKTNWGGRSDSDGLPLSKLSNGMQVYFPILLCQKALGHWDLWLMHAHSEDREDFLRIARWLALNQDSVGGWDTWGPLGQPRQYRYSAMTQGQAASVMVRAYQLTHDPNFEAGCRCAMALMWKPVQDGGVCFYESDNAFLEEFPSDHRDTVLNGWIFALFGIYDYLLEFPDEQVKAFYSLCHASLIRSLSDFDTGYWSYYSSGTKRLASPFYHRLHVSQLEALRRVATEKTLDRTQEQWTGYERNRIYRSWAVVRKGIQKLREPRQVTIIG